MKRWIVIAACAGMFFTSCGSQQAPAISHKGQMIAVTDTLLAAGGTDTVRFGRMHTGEIAQLHLGLENQTAHPIVLLAYDRTCGCTTLDFQNQPIMPEKSLPLTITFDARGVVGWQLKTLDLRFAGSERRLRIFVEAEVQ